MGGSDKLLAVRAAHGDRRAFDAIYRRYSPPLYRFCLAMTGNVQDAQDALQNTMVKVLRALPGEQREIKLKPWLYRIARNESLEALRRRQRDAQLAGDTASLAGVAETVETRERLRSLLADLAALPERQRATLVMREMAGLGFAEIALVFGTSKGATRQTLYEARLRLRELESARELGWDEEIERRSEDLVALAPVSLPLAASLGGAGGSMAGKAVTSSALFKLVATVAASVAIVTVADRGGLVSLPVGIPSGEAGDATRGPSRVVSPIPLSFITRPPPDRKGRADVGSKAPGAAPPRTAAPHQSVDAAARASSDLVAPSGPGDAETTAPAGSTAGSPAGRLDDPAPQTEREPSSTDSDQSGAGSLAAESAPHPGHDPPANRQGRGAEARGKPETPGESTPPPAEAPGPSVKPEGPPHGAGTPPAKPEGPPGKPEAPAGKPEAPPGGVETPGGKPEAPPGRS